MNKEKGGKIESDTHATEPTRSEMERQYADSIGSHAIG